MSRDQANLLDRPLPVEPAGGERFSPPYLLFLGDTIEPGYAKTAFGLRDWAPEKCIGEYALSSARVTTGLERVTPREAGARGARSLVIGVANAGGFIPPSWASALIEALEAGLDIVSGMHARLQTVPGLSETAARLGRRLIDVRVPPPDIPTATGLPRSGTRILTVGTDCALGKKYTALAIAQGLQRRGLDATFRATGQTGIMIAGAGMPIDAVVVDFVSGAAELLSPAASPDHIDVIEGQGSLFHPSYAAVTLGLLHGSQPDRFVVCHDPSRSNLLGHAGFELPSIDAVIAQTVAMGRLTNARISCAGISVNTAMLAENAVADTLRRVSQSHGLPAADPMRGGEEFERLLDACLT